MEDDGENLISFKWNNHQTTFFNVLANLRAKDIYTDVTLACDQNFISAHKLVLSSCSDYFKEVFARAACISPVVILKDIKITELEALIDYMYLGEADVKENEVSGVLKAAECLRIKGLGVPDNTFNNSLSSISLMKENEVSLPSKKIKLENENSIKKPASSILIGYNDYKKQETQNFRRKQIPKEKRYPLLSEAKKHALNSSRSMNNFKKLPRPQIRKKNPINAHHANLEKKREINVIALPTSEKKVQLMTLEMQGQNFESPDLETFQYPATHHSYDNSVLAQGDDNTKLDFSISKQVYISNTPKGQSIYDYSSPENNMDSEISPFVKMAPGNLKAYRKSGSNVNHTSNSDMEVVKLPKDIGLGLYEDLTEVQDYNKKKITEDLNFESDDYIEAQPSKMEENNMTSNISDGDLSFATDRLKTYEKRAFSNANLVEDALLNAEVENFSEMIDYNKEENRVAETANASGSAEIYVTGESGLKLPIFTSKVHPFLNGEKVDDKKLKKLRMFMVDELVANFKTEELKNTNTLNEIESLILKKYPNVTKDVHSKRAGHLGFLFQSVLNRLQRISRNISYYASADDGEA